MLLAVVISKCLAVATGRLVPMYRLCYNLRRKAPLDVYDADQQMISFPKA